MKLATSAICAVLALTTSANAFNLQITELWPGNEPGANLTPDWIEITNFGTTAWNQGADGFLWFDDNSQDAASSDPMIGITSIAPGESVIYVEDGDATDFINLWSPVLTLPQVGTHTGSGLGQGGDGATLFLTATNTQPTSVFDIIDFEAYPDASLAGGQSYDVVLGTFSGSIGAAVTTIGVNDVNQPAIGTPGFVVPEPAAALLALVAAGFVAARRN